MANELGKVLPVSVEDEMQRAYIDYSMSVIIGRALPDVRDGLKPGNRRILFAMRQLGLAPNRAFTKSAKVVGEVIGNYHPHGDAAVYDTLVRMAQDFSLRYLLVDGQGNFGSIDGDPPAAYRYTECRLTAAAEEMLADIDRDTVDHVPNFNEEREEPTVLPSRIPNLLANGSTGIAVGMATNIPPHNLGELVDGLIHLIDHPGASVEQLMRFIKGPDFPTGGIICGTSPILQAYRTGRGLLRVRGRAEIEEGKGGREMILITEIPYGLSKAALIEKMAELVRAKRIDGISDLRDESDKDGMRIVIELRRDAIAKVVLNQLYKHTQLEATFGAILLAIDHGRPRTLSLKELMSCYVEHRREVIVRRTQFDLARAEARAHILEGLRIALDNLDEVVRTIREASDRDGARAQLMARFELSEAQADAILDMRLYQLTGLERGKIEEEYRQVLAQIEDLRAILASEQRILDLIKAELAEVKEKYGDARRTQIVPEAGEIQIEDLIANEGCIITVTHAGYVKRTPVSIYRTQRRGGRGITGWGTKSEDFVEYAIGASTHDALLFFTTSGKVYCANVYEIPEGSRTARGKAIVNLLEVPREDSLAAMIRIEDFDPDLFLVMVTRRGMIKKTPLSEYRNVHRGGIIAINILDGDELLDVRLTRGEDEIVLATRQGLAIRFPEANVRPMGRATQGVRGIDLQQDDTVVSMAVVDPDATLLTVCAKGYGKRSAFEEYRSQHRGGKGLINIRTSERNGEVVAALVVRDGDELMLITSQGMMVRFRVDENLRVIGRATQGVRLINLREGDAVVACIPVVAGERDEEGEDGAETIAGDAGLPEEPEAPQDEIEPSDPDGPAAEE